MEYEQLQTDVLVIGAGAAGCRAAIEAHDRGADVGVDGYQVYPDQFFQPGGYVEVEYERVGLLRSPIRDLRPTTESEG